MNQADRRMAMAFDRDAGAEDSQFFESLLTQGCQWPGLEFTQSLRQTGRGAVFARGWRRADLRLALRNDGQWPRRAVAAVEVS